MVFNDFLFLGFMVFCLTLNLITFRFGKLAMFGLGIFYVLMMNIAVLKQFDLFGFATAGGNVVYAALFLLTDIISEHYGKKDAYKLVRYGFLAMILFVIVTQVFIRFTPNSSDIAHDSLSFLFSLSPRVLFGSLLAFFISQNLDVFLYGAIKKWTSQKYLFLRNNLSTLTSQLVDTLVFTFVGMTALPQFGIPGIIPAEIFWEVVIVSYALKVFVGIIDTPFLYLSYWVKKRWNRDLKD